VYGPGGAAELLEMNVSTLNSRMKKLGIEKPRLNNKQQYQPPKSKSNLSGLFVA
jgi:hypothetical protein